MAKLQQIHDRKALAKFGNMEKQVQPAERREEEEEMEREMKLKNEKKRLACCVVF
jgi:hypothetical protein